MPFGKNHRPKLKRDLNLFELTLYGVGIILGAGIYALIGKAAGVAGNALWMAFVIGAAIAALTGLSYAELGAMIPKEAAEYVYTKRAFRKPALSFVIGWLIIITTLVSAATVSLGFGGYFYNLTGFDPIISAILLIIGCSFLNFWGIKQSAKANVIFTLIEVSGLILIIFLGAKFLGSVNYFEMPNGFAGVMSAAILIFFAYLGFEDIVNLSEETKNPRKIIPIAIVLSVIISSILYILVSATAVSVLPWQTLGTSSAPMADVAAKALPGSEFLLSLIALFATANTVLVMAIVHSRMIWGMARDSSMPKIFSTLHPKRCTPHIAIFTMMFVMILFAVTGNIKTIAEITDLGAFLIFISVNASLIYLRYKEPDARRPFKVPFNIGKFPILPFIGMLFCTYMLFNFEMRIIYVGLIILISGAVTFYILKNFKKIK